MAPQPLAIKLMSDGSLCPLDRGRAAAAGWAMLHVRPATAADIPEIQAIYAHHVLTGTGTFEEVPPTVEEMAARFGAIASRGWPYLVATDETGILGYAYAAQVRDRAAYRYTAEDSIYLRADCAGRGIGRALLAALLDAAEAAGFREMLAVIGDAANAGSVGVHAALGFRHVGVWEAVGFKHGRCLDVVHMQRKLGDPAADTKF